MTNYTDETSGSGVSSADFDETGRVVLQSDIDKLNGGVGLLGDNPSPSGNDSGLKPVGGLGNYSRKKFGPDDGANPNN